MLRLVDTQTSLDGRISLGEIREPAGESLAGCAARKTRRSESAVAVALRGVAESLLASSSLSAWSRAAIAVAIRCLQNIPFANAGQVQCDSASRPPSSSLTE